MSRVKLFVVAAAAALILTIAQPRPAQAGDAGKIIAGIAVGAITAAIVHSRHRDHTYYAPPHAYYYYAPPHPTYYDAPYYAPRRHTYYAPRYYHPGKRYYSSSKRYRSYQKKPSRYLLSHPSQFRSKYGFSPDSAQGKAFIKSFR